MHTIQATTRRALLFPVVCYAGDYAIYYVVENDLVTMFTIADNRLDPAKRFSEIDDMDLLESLLLDMFSDWGVFSNSSGRGSHQDKARNGRLARARWADERYSAMQYDAADRMRQATCPLVSCPLVSCAAGARLFLC